MNKDNEVTNNNDPNNFDPDVLTGISSSELKDLEALRKDKLLQGPSPDEELRQNAARDVAMKLDQEIRKALDRHNISIKEYMNNAQMITKPDDPGQHIVVNGKRILTIYPAEISGPEVDAKNGAMTYKAVQGVRHYEADDEAEDSETEGGAQ